MIIKERKVDQSFWSRNYSFYVNPENYEMFKKIYFGAKFLELEHGPDGKDFSKCSKRCMENPNCMQGIKIWNLEEIVDCAEEKNVAVGIKNLGATCYLNTLLQIWYYNAAFRTAIYSYRADPLNLDILGKIQLVFSELQSVTSKFIDVKGLVEMLHLAPTVQQDALEFSKLLISLLEQIAVANKSKSPNILKAFSQYQGEYQFTVRCLKCQTGTSRYQQFYELEVSISDQASALPEAIKNALSSERLEGDNQYMCSTCNSKQDAIKSVKLAVIPDTLNFQVNRFIFDAASYTKRKSSAQLYFPAEIDMAEFSSTRKKNHSMMYDLTAVLLHRGTSANSGHYLARVYNQETQIWLDCDDECVTKLDPVDFQIDAPDDDSNVWSSRGKRKRARLQQDSLEVKEGIKNGMLSSNAVYLLVYERRKLERPTYPFIPGSLTNLIPHGVIDLEKEEESKLVVSEWRTKRLKDFLELYSMWHIPADDSNAIYVAADSFESALDIGTGALSEKTTISESDIDNAIQVNNELILCQHGKLDPEAVRKSKRLNPEAVKKIQLMNYCFSQVLTIDDVCDQCFQESIKNHIETFNHSKDLQMLEDVKRSPLKFWISKAWFTEWKKKFPFGGIIPSPDDPKYRKDVFCEHGGLSTTHSTIGISSPMYKVIQKRFPKFKSISLLSEMCPQCLIADNEIALSEKQVEDSKYEMESLKRLSSSKGRLCHIYAGLTYYLIPESFVIKWKKYHRRSSNNVSPVEQISTRSLVCSEHEKLICNFPKSARKGYEKSVLPNSCVVDEQEWKTLCGFYKIDGPEIIVKLNTDNTLLYSPDFCSPCCKAMQLNYTTANISVLKRPNFPVDTLNSISSSTTTSNKRRRISSGNSSRKMEKVSMEIKPSTTVKELKEALLTKFKAPIYYQKLFFKEIEVLNDSTMEGLGVIGGDELELEIFEEKNHHFDDDTTGLPECGFQGTMLSGLTPVVQDPGFWECKICTLVNHAASKLCEACQTTPS